MPYVQTDAERLAAFPALVDAVSYLLDRAQTNAEVGYHLGRGTEALRRLCLAEAAATNRPPREVELERCRSRVPDHAVAPLDREFAAKRIELLEEHVSAADLRAVTAALEEWHAEWIARELARRAGAR